MKSVFLQILFIGSSFSYGQTISKAFQKETVISKSMINTDTIHKKDPGRLIGIVKNISLINEVQSEHIGIAGTNSENYQNFLLLKKKATVDELLNLIHDTNSVVACYASWALADKSYPYLPCIFQSFLKRDRSVKTFNGCIGSVDNISNELYYRYWNSVANKNKSGNRMLLQLDSIILYHDHSYWLLLASAFENRIYPNSYKSRIEDLAFRQGNIEAIYYLCNWYRADNYDKLKRSLVAYLKKTNFSKIGTSEYYRTIDELLKFKDSEIEALIIQKLKKDKHWKYDKERFESLLGDYSIYENFD